MIEPDIEDPDDGFRAIEPLVDDFLTRLRRGEAPTIESYAARHPDHAAEIREVFAAMQALEGLKSAEDLAAKSATSPPRLERLGDFRIVEEIGRGGMGVVYEAEQVTLGRRVAIKILPRELGSNHARRERFHREARTAAALHHTNIVPVFGSGEADGCDYYVMQRIAGLGLDRVIRALARDPEPEANTDDVSTVAGSEALLSDVVGRMRDADLTQATEAESATTATREPSSEPAPRTGSIPAMPRALYRNVARIGIQLGEALHYAHGQGTLHRDIKPANLLLDCEGTAWVTDFGLAKALEHVDLTRSGDVIGTLRYLAPEQFTGRTDERSDLYSLGLSLYELCALRPAFPGMDRQQTIAAICSGRGPRRLTEVAPATPRDLATVIEKACAATPTDRYRHGNELADDLRRFLDDRPISARPVSALESAWRWCRRNRTSAALALVAVFALLAATIAGWVGYAETRSALAVAESRRLESEAARQRTSSNLLATLGAFDSTLDEICGPDSHWTRDATTNSSEDEELASEQRAPISRDLLPLLERILAYYQDFTTRNEDRPEVAWQAGVAHRRVGDIQQRLGDLDEAATAYRDALRLFGKADPDIAPPAERAMTIARTRIQLGRVLQDLAQPNPAIEQLRLALSNLAVVPQTPEIRLATAEAHNAIALSIPRFGQAHEPGQAPGDRHRIVLEHHLEALAILEALATVEPREDGASDRDDPAASIALARTLRHLAHLPGPRGASAIDGPAAPRTDAIAILEALLTDRPEDSTIRFELAETLRASRFGGPVLGPPPRRPRHDDLPPAADLQRAYELLAALTESNPNVVSYRESLAEVCQSRAESALRSNESDSDSVASVWFARAEQEWSRVLDASSEPTHRQAMSWLSLTTRNASRNLRDDVPGAARRALEPVATHIDELYSSLEPAELPRPLARQIGNVYALLADACRRDGDPTSADRAERQSRRYRPGSR